MRTTGPSFLHINLLLLIIVYHSRIFPEFMLLMRHGVINWKKWNKSCSSILMWLMSLGTLQFSFRNEDVRSRYVFFGCNGLHWKKGWWHVHHVKSLSGKGFSFNKTLIINRILKKIVLANSKCKWNKTFYPFKTCLNKKIFNLKILKELFFYIDLILCRLKTMAFVFLLIEWFDRHSSVCYFST